MHTNKTRGTKIKNDELSTFGFAVVWLTVCFYVFILFFYSLLALVIFDLPSIIKFASDEPASVTLTMLPILLTYCLLITTIGIQIRRNFSILLLLKLLCSGMLTLASFIVRPSPLEIAIAINAFLLALNTHNLITYIKIRKRNIILIQ